ncbi:MAG: NAD(P)/FAD-dependent oxidoreductase [Thermoleophilaceae bacterium]|nr:NAD(P)/FAD-dependent oxidoreductase [Thermoleophilaceae bacterium]
MAWNVVVVGGGFGGLNAARTIEKKFSGEAVKVTLVSEQNFLLYTPFLPEAAAGTLEPRHVVTPLRDLLRKSRLTLGSMTGLDAARRVVHVRNAEGDPVELRYDRLVLAPGSVSRTLPIPGLAEHGAQFKSLADAIWLRNHVVRSLELAETVRDPRRLDELLSFVFVGGGYAGLEALAELQDFATDAMKMYPAAREHGMRWMLIEAADRVLRELDPKLAAYTVRELSKRGIDVRLETQLSEVTATDVLLSTGERIETRTLVWTAGVKPSPLVDDLGLPLDAAGRIVVDAEMRVEGHEEIWAIGDAAAVPNPSNPDRPTPPTAQHARRQGIAAGLNVAASLGKGRARSYDYKDRGSFVNLGRYKAVAMTGKLRLRGPLAWWMARTYHVSQIPGFSRKLRAVIDWTVSLPFSRDVSEVGSIGHPRRLDGSLTNSKTASVARSSEAGLGAGGDASPTDPRKP